MSARTVLIAREYLVLLSARNRGPRLTKGLSRVARRALPQGWWSTGRPSLSQFVHSTRSEHKTKLPNIATKQLQIGQLFNNPDFPKNRSISR